MCELNLKRSPENSPSLEWADSVCVDAGEMEGAIGRVPTTTPGVSDSIELHNGETFNQASDEQRLLGNRAMQVPEYGRPM